MYGNRDDSKKMLAKLNEMSRAPLSAFQYQQLTVTGAADALTVPEGAIFAKCRVESATTTGIIMYYSECGATTVPTTSTGIPVQYLDYFEIEGSNNLINFRIIAVSGSHTLNVVYFR